jgi:hypothetical protein
VAGCRTRRRGEERQQEEQQPAFRHGLSALCYAATRSVSDLFFRVEVNSQVFLGGNCLGGALL